MLLFLSLIMTLLLMTHSDDLDQDIRRIKVASIIEDSIQHVRAFEVIQFFCRQTNSSSIELVFETHNLTSKHPVFMDGRVGPILGENVQLILWIVTCETLDFLPNKLQPVSTPSFFLTVDSCKPPKPTENIGLRYIAIADVIERLKWTDLNLIYDISIGGSAILLLLKELSTRFVKSSLYAINTTSDDYEEKIFDKFIKLNQKSYSQNQFLVILKNESLAKILNSASVLMMTMGKLYWLLVDDNLQPDNLLEFGVNPQNANMLLLRKTCDRERKDLRKVNKLIDDLKDMFPKDNKYIVTLTCMMIKSLRSQQKPNSKSLAKCREGSLDSMTNASGILLSNQSEPPNSCYPAFEVATLHEGFDDSLATTIARWRPDTKLIVKDDFFPNKKYKLGNATLLVSTLPLSPYAMRLTPEKNSGFKGFAITILEELSLRMNFSYKWKEPEDEQFGMLKNGSFTGLVGLLQRREVDLVIGALTVSYKRSLAVDYTYPYTEEGRGMLIRKPTDSSMNDLFKVFRAFKPVTWLSFAVVVVIVAVVLAIIDGFKRMSDSNNTIRGLPDNRTAKRICLFSHLSWKEALWSIYTMHLFQGGAQEPTSSRSRVIIMCWWLFTILISTYYTANLTAHFTISVAPSTIESLSDLAKDESVVPVTLEGSAMYEELRLSDDPIKQQVYKRMKVAPNPKTAEESLPKVKSGKYVFISLWSQVKTLAAENCEDLMVPGKPYGIKRIGFALPKGSALTADISTMLGIMREAGLIDKWRRAWWIEKASCRRSDDQKPMILDMNSLGGVYIVFGAFTLVAFIILGLELMNHKQVKRKRITLDDVMQY